MFHVKHHLENIVETLAGGGLHCVDEIMKLLKHGSMIVDDYSPSRISSAVFFNDGGNGGSGNRSPDLHSFSTTFC